MRRVALPAGELVRVPVDVRGIRPTSPKRARTWSRAVVGPLAVHAAGRRRWRRSSAADSARHRGPGRRSEPSSQSSHCARRQADQAGAIESDSPRVGATRPSTSRAVVVLPQPDSPTRANVSPRATSKLTSATALTRPTARRKTPARTGKSLTRPRTSRSGDGAGWGRRRAGRYPAPARRLAGVTSPRASTRWHALDVPGTDDHVGREHGGARRRHLAKRAAGMEGAAVGPVHERGRLTVDPEQRGVPSTLVEAGQRRQQPERVGMARRGKEGVDGCALDAAAGVEHDDPVGEPGDHAEVVGDEQDRRARALADPLEHVEDLGLQRHVERGRRLVHDEQRRVVGQRHGEHGAR